MKKRELLGLIAFGGLAAALSCDGASSGTSGGLDASDCPVGMFKPVGLADCVFPAVDINNQPVGVSDNRCASGQPAVPPQCFSENGRAYLASSMTCAPNYRYLPGACNRNVGGAAGFPGGFVGAAGTTGVGTGFGGDSQTGFGGIGGVGAAGSPFTGASGAGGDLMTGGGGMGGAPLDGGDAAGAGGATGTI